MTNILAVCRVARGWKQRQIAYEIGVNIATYSRWEVGDACPSAADYAAIQAAYGPELWAWARLRMPEMMTRERGRPRKVEA